MRKHMLRPTPKGFDGRVGRIVTSEDGGPIRRIINGRSKRPTGTFTAIKAGGRAMPHESVEGELRAMWIAEAATCVRKMLAQPHRLEISVSGRSRPLLYFPDLLLEMDEAAASRIVGGQPFAQAMFAEPENMGGKYTRTVVLEIKTGADRRMEDAEYRLKLSLARKLYRGLGVVFAVVQADPGLLAPDLSAVKRIVMNRHVAIDSRDIEIAASRVQDGPVALVDLAASLGSSHLGISKAFALHVRRVISIDLNGPVGPQTAIHRMKSAGTRRAPRSAVWPKEPYAKA
ncbi:MAG: hypothetical protein EOS27_14250 [Mesorhizobium sp.]|nr:MAG: hypothetical protein EOS27_14250 [Mesorhizobium sp.]